MHNKIIIFAFWALLVPHCAVAQDYDADLTANRERTSTVSSQGTLSMTFTSETEVKFYIYINGHLQNATSTGRITINGLMDKDYHIRIVMDDPFEISTTRTMRPSKTETEYAVRFNPVKEYIYVNRRKERVTQGEWYNTGATTSAYSNTGVTRSPNEKSERKLRKERKEAEEAQGSTGKNIMTTKTPYLEE